MLRSGQHSRSEYGLQITEAREGRQNTQRRGGTPDSSPAFQRRVSWPNYSRPEGTAENTTDGDGVPFQACLRRADLFISLPTTEVAGCWQGSLRDRTSSSYTMACWVTKLGFSRE